ncbi:MAG: PAS domain S-box protein [Candidatus Hydrothermarchaeales archaeon]
MSILLVEDSEDQIKLCKDVLSRRGNFKVDVAKNGRDAQEKIGQNDYDAILLDYILPDITGMDILKQTRENGYDKPIIMVTGKGSEEVAVEAMTNGASDYIIKTSSYYQDLPHRVQRSVERHRLERELRESNAELLLLQKVNNALSSNVSIDEILDIITDGLISTFGYDTSAINILSDDGRYLEVKSVGLGSKVFRAIEEYTGMSIVGYKIPLFQGSMHKRMLETKKPILSNDPVSFYEDWTDQKRLKPLAKGLARITKGKWLISVPLSVGEKMVGTIGVGSRNRLTDADVERLQTFSEQAGLAIERARLERELIGYAEQLEQKVEERTRELQRTEERYRDLVENVNDIIYAHDLEGNFWMVNKKLVESFGYSRDELLKMNIKDLIEPGDHGRISKAILRAMERGSISGFEVRGVTKDGRKMYLEGNASIIEEGGNPVGIRAIVRDITDRKRAEEELMKKLMKFRIERGRTYLIEEGKMDKAKDVFLDLLGCGYDGVIITRTNPKDIKKRFERDVEVVWVGEKKRGRDMVLPKFSELEKMIERFIGPYSVILLDRLDYLIARNGFEETLHFIQGLNELFYIEDSILVLSIDPRTLTHRELSFLENETNKVESKFVSSIPDDLLDILKLVYKQNKLGEYPSYKEIGKNLNITKGTVRKRINALKGKGLVIDRKKGRFKLLELTEEGRAFF